MNASILSIIFFFNSTWTNLEFIFTIFEHIVCDKTVLEIEILNQTYGPIKSIELHQVDSIFSYVVCDSFFPYVVCDIKSWNQTK